MIGQTVTLTLDGLSLTAEEKEILQHPQVGGVVLFKYNYESVAQLLNLISQIRSVVPHLLISVDHEGGRVQRFRSGFTELPAFGKIGDVYNTNQELALNLAQQHGWLMAAELLAAGVDFSYTPVLDLAKGVSAVIGDRAFHQNPEIVTELARAYIKGMNSAGMAAIGKHFPGHGSVSIDSHIGIPVDERQFDPIENDDLIPFAKLCRTELAGIMPAHIIYPKMDLLPVGFSKLWIQDILRNKLKFQGAIISDDLTMEGAACIGDFPERARTALLAGCDQVLVCNNRNAALAILQDLERQPIPDVNRGNRMKKLTGQFGMELDQLQKSSAWQQARELLETHCN